MSTPPDSPFGFPDPDGQPGTPPAGRPDGRPDGRAADADEAGAFSVSAFDLSGIGLASDAFDDADFEADGLADDDFAGDDFAGGGFDFADEGFPAGGPSAGLGAEEPDDVEAFFNPGAAGLGPGFGAPVAGHGLYGDGDTPGTPADAATAPGTAPRPEAQARPAKGDGKGDGGRSADSAKGRKRRAVTGVTLGVSVGAHALHAVLLRAQDGRYDILRQFSRQRTAMLHSGDHDGFQTPEMDAGEDDVRLQIGDASAADLGAGDLFLDAEFGDLGLDAPEHEFTPAAPRRQSQPIVFELKDLLDECAALGFDRPPVALSTAPPDVAYVEVLLTRDKKARAERKGKKKDPKPEPKKDPRRDAKDPADPADADALEVKRERLLETLAEATEQPFDKERVQFVPMTPRDGLRRFLAVVPSEEDPVEESLDLLREQAGMKAIPFRVHTAEVPTLIGLARMAFRPAAAESTAIVRVGAEDTLVILLEGDQLHHAEQMLSVTAFDGPDTICSRVLLQQDVQGIGTVHNVLVVSEEREGELVQGFSAFYPDARVEPLRAGLLGAGVLPPPGKRIAAVTLPALGVALAATLQREKDTPFADVNLLPKRLRRTRSRVELAVAWHTLVAGVLLFLAVLFFVGSFFKQEARIAEARQAVAAYPAEVSLSSRQLQARIDSLEAVHRRITRGLATVDSLLVGSDLWSRSLSRSAAAADAVGGVWVDAWDPGASTLLLRGRATQRAQVVQFAERMGGAITQVAFTEIRGLPVYQFEVDVPLVRELPEVAVWLREHAAAHAGSGTPVPLAATAAGPSAP